MCWAKVSLVFLCVCVCTHKKSEAHHAFPFTQLSHIAQQKSHCIRHLLPLSPRPLHSNQKEEYSTCFRFSFTHVVWEVQSINTVLPLFFLSFFSSYERVSVKAQHTKSEWTKEAHESSNHSCSELSLSLFLLLFQSKLSRRAVLLFVSNLSALFCFVV